MLFHPLYSLRSLSGCHTSPMEGVSFCLCDMVFAYPNFVFYIFISLIEQQIYRLTNGGKPGVSETVTLPWIPPDAAGHRIVQANKGGSRLYERFAKREP
jgi:hypothetical protein